MSKKSRIISLLAISILLLWETIVIYNADKLPQNFSYTAQLLSSDNFYNESTGEFAGEIHTSSLFALYTLSNDSRYSSITNTFDVFYPDQSPIISVARLYGIDRYSKKHVHGRGDKDRTGYLFAPTHLTEGESFTYWHINYDAPAQMKFIEEDTLFGLPVFKYETRYEGVHIDQTKHLLHMPEVGTSKGIEVDPHLTLWIEPITGYMVKYEDNATAYYYDLATGERLHPWNTFNNKFEEASILKHVDIAKKMQAQQKIIHVYIPFLLIVVVLAQIYTVIIPSQIRKRYLTSLGLTTAFNIIVIVGSIVTLLGWHNQNASYIRLVPLAAGMNPVTAICFILLAGGTILSFTKQKAMALISFLIVATVSSVRITEYLGLLPLQIDLILYREYIHALEIPSRMAAYTALSFLCLALAQLSASVKALRRIRLPSILSIVILLLSTITVTSHLFDGLKIFSLPELLLSAFHTAIFFQICAFSSLVVCTKKQEGNTSVSWKELSAVLFVTISITVAFTLMVSRSYSLQAETRFTNEVEEAISAIQERLSVYVNTLQSGKALFQSSEVVSREEWHTYIAALQIQQNYPGIQGIGYAVFVPPEEKQIHIQSIRNEGFPTYTIHPEGERDIYSAIIYLEPFDLRNQQAFGYDMYSEQVRRSAMSLARDTGKPQMSGRITLVQEIDEDIQPGFLVYTPYYGNEGDPETTEKRQSDIIGFIYAPFRARDFIEGIFGVDGMEDISIRISDGGQYAPSNIIYDNTEEGSVESSLHSRFKAKRIVYLAGRPWLMEFVSTPTYGTSTAGLAVSMIVLIVGIAISCLIAMLYTTLIRSRQKAIAYADEVTKDLREAKENAETTLDALNASALVSMTDIKGNITYVNNNFAKASKYTQKELLGKNHRILKSNKMNDSVFTNLWHTISNGNIWRGEIQNQAKDGTYFWVDTTIAPILNENRVPKAYLSIRFLITEKKEAEVQMEKTQKQLERSLQDVQKFQKAVDSSSDAIAITDPDGTILFVNDVWETLNEYSESEALGKNPNILKSGRTPEHVYTELRSALQKGDRFHSEEMINKTKSGKEYNAELTIYPILDKNGTVENFVGIQKDITARVRAEKAKSEFVSLASHQLRTPLTALRWIIERIYKEKAGELNMQQKELVGNAHESCLYMNDTINTMLMLSRYEAAEMELKIQKTDLLQLIHKVIDRNQPITKKRNQHILVHCDDAVTVSTDTNLLIEVVHNILNNAIKYSPNKSQILVTLTESDTGGAIIEIQDKGYGIPRNEQDRIFTKFFRGENVISKETEGSGLGLYLVASLVKLIDIGISFQSKENEGTTFSLTIPPSITHE